jgi:hypothetical protein
MMVLHPEVQPRVGTSPGQQSCFREALLASLVPNLEWHSSNMTVSRSNANRVLGALSQHEATRLTGQPFARCAKSQALVSASRWCYSTQAYGGTASVPCRCLNAATEEHGARRMRCGPMNLASKQVPSSAKPRALPMAYTRRSSIPEF